ncbi:MAG TPA: glycosyltransferase [Acidimicrobiales bacterium]|nr:glycosyltransferase [Acidimicrobiales bacterium]
MNERTQSAASTSRPERIDQVIPSIIEHDAVSNHTFVAQRLLREMGFVSEIYAAIIGPGCAGRVHPLGELPSLADGTQWVVYQCSIGGPAANVVARHPGRKLLDYHNITPAALVEHWLPPLAEESRLGRRQLQMLAPLVSDAFARSAYSAAELVANGFKRTTVVPILAESGNFDELPDAVWLERLGTARSKGGADWLFVGQIAPHKAQHDLIKAFVCYRRVYDGAARLHLVGREMGSTYIDALRRFAAALGVTDAISLPGSVSVGALVAYYETADVFVCLSDHEGFCAPIVEAMSRGVPAVAYAAAAVPETVGEAGVLLPEKSPAVVASAVHRLLADAPARASLVAAGRARAARYTPEAASAAFRRAIEDVLAAS